MRTLLAEDHPLMQERVVAVLSEAHDVVSVINRGDQILDATLRHTSDAAVLDVSLPGRSGLQVLPELRDRHPSLAIVILTTHDSPLFRKEAFDRGADAYVQRQNAIEELLLALHAAIPARRCTNIPFKRLA